MLVVLITLVATLAIQLGYFCWKVAADSLPRIGEESVAKTITGFLCNGKWLLGFLCTTLGWVLFIKATELGEISVVQPLMSVGDLFLVLLAVVFLHERLRKEEWAGLALTVAGAVVLSFDAHIAPPLAIDWVRLALLLAAIVGGGFVLYRWGRNSPRPEVPLAIVVGCGFGIGAVLTELMTAYLTLSGESLGVATGLWNPVLPFMVAANVAGLILLQVAFQRGRAAVIIPVQLSVVNGIVVVVGVLVFSEVVTLYRLFAIALMVAGTAWLHKKDSPSGSAA